MNELTIEEKAKAYDYAVNKAKELILNENGVVRVDKPLFDELFPSEMEESEDERIRKGLIEYFKDFRLGTFAYLEPKKIIAWLEKQGTPAKLSEEEQNRFAKGVLTSCAMSFIDYLDAHKYEGKMCVSNGECEDIENAFHNAMWDRLHRYYCKYIEKQGEKKPCMIQWKGDNLKEVIDFTGKDKNFEKWFKSFEEYEKYVGDHNGIFKLFNEDGSHYEVPVGAWIVKTPDGYNIASKAVLKQKSAVEWSEEDQAHLESIDESLFMFESGRHENVVEGIEDDRNWLKSLKDRVGCEMNCTTTKEWSEEDEDNFKHLMDEIVCLGNSRNSANRLHYDRLIKFLYELKNRAQPREEWRDKDERMLDRLIAYFEKQVAFTDDDNPRYAKWLKSLRPQNRWKPSDEQIEMLEKVRKILHDKDIYSKANNLMYNFEELIRTLKKLKEE